MHWAIARCIGCGGGGSVNFNVNNTDDETNDTNYESDDENNT